MNLLEIALIIIGIVIILISALLVDKSQKSPVAAEKRDFSFDASLTEEDKKKLMNKLEELLADVSEEVIVRTDDTLSKISNEKIMAVNEFSEQILEKINRNHEEVVFLYNMLNDKEKELKLTVKEIDNAKKKIEDLLEDKVTNEPVQKPVKVSKTEPVQRESSQGLKADKPLINPTGTAQATPEVLTTGSVGSNNNSQILKLHAQGKSIMEISKLLDLGQGEVKLVIDLFRGKK